ncbi:copper chaperone PCu(A)C [Tateyamaria sp.]|uniref:copper chaperone PCu(A)C n=1 Tax=Tateyamaria sp. TaxID=1929288 RepID=UPI00329DF631
MSYRVRILAAVTAAFLAVPAFADGVMVMDSYARAASPNAKSGAAFMTLHNTGNANDRLIGARTDAAKRVELHTHTETGDGILKMHEIEGGIALPAGGIHQMVRGKDHVMLMGLTGALTQGDEIEVTLVFEKAGEVTVTIPVDNERTPKAGSHDHSGHKDDSHDHSGHGAANE